MSNILAISSSVANGHVGLAAIVPALNLLGRTAIALPTVILSNHPALAHHAGTQIAPATLTAMLDAIDANGALQQCDTVVTGYLPTRAHVAVAADAIDRIQRHRRDKTSVQIICDPVLGDDPAGLYIATDAANAIREQLLPRATTITPNRFELAWLSGHVIASEEDAITAARILGPPRIIAKSVPTGDTPTQYANLEITLDTATRHPFTHLANAPHGTGDMLSGLIAAGWSLGRATVALSSVIAESHGKSHLAIVETAARWTKSQ